MARPAPSRAVLGLTLILMLGALPRAFILGSPLGEVEADESVVGLMALHILRGEHFAFYWGQPFLGSLEAYLVAAAFAVPGPSNLALKLVPGLLYLVFVALVFLGARRDHGCPIALLSAAYLAFPPSFLALWSLKARGGYVELLVLGQALILLAPWFARNGPHLAWRMGLGGLLGGTLVWTHLLGFAYVLPTGLFLLARLGRRLTALPLMAGLVGGLIGLLPALVANLSGDWETLRALSSVGQTEETVRDHLGAFLRVGLPVVAGLGQATSSPILFAEDWPGRPASWAWLPPLLFGLCCLVLLPTLSALLAPWRARGAEHLVRPGLTLGVLLLTPLLASLGRFGDLVAEPRYALPLYSGVPLLFVGLARLARRARLAALMLGGLVFAVNGYSLVAADPRLNLPTTAAGSTAANRAVLVDYLERRGLTELYTDYWLAYPLMFESRERVTAKVISGGYDRFPPYAHYVASSERPAFVFVAGLSEHVSFDNRIRERGLAALHDRAGIYEVYWGMDPAAALDRTR